MSKLKSFIVLYDGKFIRAYNESEADKVIAKLNRQIKFLKTTHDACGNCNKCADGMGKVFDKDLDKLKEQLRHQKDKVIAEKDEEIAELNARIADGDKDFEMANNQNERLLKIVRHHKYKRCLAMAKWCEFYADSLRVKRNQCRYDEAEIAETYYIRCRRYRRWCKVWLELAEKFKEAK